MVRDGWFLEVDPADAASLPQRLARHRRRVGPDAWPKELFGASDDGRRGLFFLDPLPGRLLDALATELGHEPKARLQSKLRTWPVVIVDHDGGDSSPR